MSAGRITPYIYTPKAYPFVITYFETIFQCLLTNKSVYCIFVRSKAIRQRRTKMKKLEWHE